ncbi:NADH-quinone oxidoreductase subunit NuoE [Desulfallas thermosapovorans]|uniref:NADP-reducing hydrogenase subunit HndA n=1 Tax=Desulfallas thermosapovorans DSM 6562 TaxID=1121431 RepID=A0A5S4ZVV9_9FIRM|nr:NADH-quinone oxidoreductase subunit NuoE [Desulfallas thermosapovorans]TYO96915.1 NADP-reducing hydrogenase subunit HndA [Desulfallas thermosapovorans DSM 6562]
MSNGCTCHAQAQLTPEHMAQVDKIMEPYRGQPGSLIQVLHKAQNEVGYLPREVQVRVAEGLNVPLTKVYGVVSFYSLFTTKPKGKHKIHVCAGTACYVRGANELLDKLEEDLQVKPGDTTADGRFSVDVVRCLGACGLGPVVTVDDEVYGRVNNEKLDGILAKYKKE